MPTPAYGWEDAEYAVYPVALSDWGNGGQSTIVIRAQTVTFNPNPNLKDWVKQYVPTVNEEMLDDFVTRNSVPLQIEYRLSFAALMIPTSEIAIAFDPSRCQEFNSKYPKA